jgi:hypothetical protein
MMILMDVTINLMGSKNPQYTKEMIERMEMEEKIHTVTKDGKPVFPYVVFEKSDIDFKRFKK